jgi:hypothetical protein
VPSHHQPYLGAVQVQAHESEPYMMHRELFLATAGEKPRRMPSDLRPVAVCLRQVDRMVIGAGRGMASMATVMWMTVSLR